MKLNPVMTAKRREWLTRLRDTGPAVRHRSVVGYQCMHLGWTAWWVTLDDGRTMFMDEARALYTHPDHYWDHIIYGPEGMAEMITDAGRTALLTPSPPPNPTSIED